MNLRFFHPDYAPVYVPALLSLAGTLFFLYGDRLAVMDIVSNRWSPHYLLATPFIHANWAHFLLNMLVLHHIGGAMLLPLIGRLRFSLLLAGGALAGSVLNNLLTEAPAIGISAALMAVVGCALYPYAKAPMKLFVIHDFTRLPPFQFRYVVLFVVLMDIGGVIFDWNFFAHWAHLGGMSVGLAFGYLRWWQLPF